MSTVEELEQYSPRVLAEMVVQLEEEVETLKKELALRDERTWQRKCEDESAGINEASHPTIS